MGEAEYTPPPSISYKAAAPADSYLNDPSPGYRASGSVTPLGDSTGRKEYEVIDQAHYAPNEIYKSGDHDDCHYVDKLVYKDQCIPYVEKTCYTQQEEICEDVFEKNCTAVILSTTWLSQLQLLLGRAEGGERPYVYVFRRFR